MPRKTPIYGFNLFYHDESVISAEDVRPGSAYTGTLQPDPTNTLNYNFKLMEDLVQSILNGRLAFTSISTVQDVVAGRDVVVGRQLILNPEYGLVLNADHRPSPHVLLDFADALVYAGDADNTTLTVTAAGNSITNGTQKNPFKPDNSALTFSGNSVYPVVFTVSSSGTLIDTSLSARVRLYLSFDTVPQGLSGVRLEASQDGSTFSTIGYYTQNLGNKYLLLGPATLTSNPKAVRITLEGTNSTSINFKVRRVALLHEGTPALEGFYLPRAGGSVYGNMTVKGKLGISVSNPAYALDVSGDVRWTGTLQGGTVPWVRLSGHPSVNAGTGLTGGGSLSRNVTLNLAPDFIKNFSTGTPMAGDFALIGPSSGSTNYKVPIGPGISRIPFHDKDGRGVELQGVYSVAHLAGEFTTTAGQGRWVRLLKITLDGDYRGARGEIWFGRAHNIGSASSRLGYYVGSRTLPDSEARLALAPGLPASGESATGVITDAAIVQVEANTYELWVQVYTDSCRLHVVWHHHGAAYDPSKISYAPLQSASLPTPVSGGLFTQWSTASGSSKGFFVSTESIADNAIQSHQIADRAVTSAKLADGAVTNAKISVSAEKIPNLNADMVDGLHASQFLRSDADTTYNGATLTVNGNIVMAAGKTVDGVDISVFKAAYDVHEHNGTDAPKVKAENVLVQPYNGTSYTTTVKAYLDSLQTQLNNLIQGATSADTLLVNQLTVNNTISAGTATATISALTVNSNATVKGDLIVEGGANAITIKENSSDNTPGYLEKVGGTLRLTHVSTSPIAIYRGATAGPADLEILKDAASGELPIYLRFHQGSRHWEAIKATNGLISFVNGDDTGFIDIQAKRVTAVQDLVVSGRTIANASGIPYSALPALGNRDRDILVERVAVWGDGMYPFALDLFKADGWFTIPKVIYYGAFGQRLNHSPGPRSGTTRAVRLYITGVDNARDVYDPASPYWNNGRFTGKPWVRLIRESDGATWESPLYFTWGGTPNVVSYAVEVPTSFLTHYVQVALGIWWNDTSASWPTANIAGDNVANNYQNYGVNICWTVYQVWFEVYDRY